MNEKTEYRTAAWESEQDGHIYGYAVVFNSRTTIGRDPDTGIEYGEIIDPHALDNADMKDVVLRVDHEGHPLARTKNRTLSLTVDSKGLRIDADLSGSQEGRDLYEAIKNGLYDKMSFAFIVSDGGEAYDNKTRTRIIRSIERLYDVAVVTFPAYDETSVLARARLDSYIAEDRKAFYQAENRKALCSIDEIIDRYDLTGQTLESFNDPYNELTEREKIYKRMIEIRERCADLSRANNVLIGKDPLDQLHALETELVNERSRQTATRKAVANGEGRMIAKAPNDSNTNERKKHTMSETRDMFYKDLIEKRAAAGVSGMSNVIPADILDYALREGNNGLLPLISTTHIANGGNVRIPYMTDLATTVAEHTENDAITPGNYVPSAVTISHAEYQQTLAYSYLGTSIAERDLQRIIEDALIGAMSVKLDSVALAAINALTWVKTAGATQNAVQWATSGSPLLSEILDLMKLLPAQYSNGAKFIMSKATALAIIKNSTGNVDDSVSNGMYNVSVLDGLTRIFGVPVVEDSNLAFGTIFYGKPDAVHMNFAGEVELANWLDRDSLTEKFQVAAAAGAGCEAGAFVKGASSIS